MNLHGKVALVTGAGRRVGRAVALELAARGAKIAVHYRNSKAEAEEVVALIKAGGGVASAYCADLTHVLEIQWLARWIEEELGYVDVLVNSASEFFETALVTSSDGDWDRLMGANVKAPFQTIRRFAPMMVQRGAGHIVNITDVYARRALPGYSIYCASKAALWMLTQSLALELAPHVQVNAVAPGTVMFPEDFADAERASLLKRIPLRREGTPEDIARAVRFLVEEGGYVTGSVLTVDGGKEIAG
ncbi:MAG: SDR family oxidoreductase [Planctomycetes bacterium]|nr:SDR family oxidoreductase [Planctomycetota bacterium]